MILIIYIYMRYIHITRENSSWRMDLRRRSATAQDFQAEAATLGQAQTHAGRFSFRPGWNPNESTMSGVDLRGPVLQGFFEVYTCPFGIKNRIN